MESAVGFLFSAGFFSSEVIMKNLVLRAVKNSGLFTWLVFSLLWVVSISGCIPDTEKEGVLRIGDICNRPEQCSADDAVCDVKVDMETRCWVDRCKEDVECGVEGACVFVQEDTEDGTSVPPARGACYTECETVEDCPKPASNSVWYCEPIKGDMNESGRNLCILERKPFCGNGIVERGEECDDGNYEDGDGCSSECQLEVGCGNGVLDVNVDERGFLWVEECDDDNVIDGDGCSSDCKIEGDGPVCGNGVLEMGEACDPALPRWKNGGCTDDCQRVDECGDGELKAGEECDDGNNINGDGCDENCKLEFVCGDGTCHGEMGEICEKCPEDCCPMCGDGFLDADEECDDGNNIGGDGCSAGCIIENETGEPECGNGIWEIGEECDPAMLEWLEGGCSDDCKIEFVCGDGFCDSDSNENCRLCPEDCCPNCGNGVREVQYGEQCDTNDLHGLTCEDLCYDGGELACTEWCEFDVSGCTGTGPVCGDGVAECDEECDGDDLRGYTCQALGYEEGTLSCGDNCEFDVSDCSGTLWYLFEDFETETAEDWTYGGDWEWGFPSVGPMNCYDESTGCAGTVLDGDYNNDNSYDTCVLESPPVNLSFAFAPVMTFYQYVDTENSYDGGNIRVSTDGGDTWDFVDNSLLDPDYYDDTVGGEWAYSGDQSSLGWHLVTVDLSGYVGETVIIRFSFHSDFTSTDPGWFIDQVLITE